MKNAASFRIPYEVLERLLGLPEGMKVRAISSIPFSFDDFSVTVEDPRLPESDTSVESPAYYRMEDEPRIKLYRIGMIAFDDFDSLG